jgi:hypothetical protein
MFRLFGGRKLDGTGHGLLYAGQWRSGRDEISCHLSQIARMPRLMGRRRPSDDAARPEEDLGTYFNRNKETP